MSPHRRHSSRAARAPGTRHLSSAIGAILLTAAGQSSAVETDDEFDPAFFAGGGVTEAVIARFSQANIVLDGDYAVTIRVNGDRKHDGLIRFARGDSQGQAQPCLSDAMLLDFGVRPDALATVPTGSVGTEQTHDCTALQDRITDAAAHFDLGRQTLDVSIPQASMVRTHRGSLRPEELDVGITAATLNYRASGHTSRGASGTTTTNYLGLQAGVNLDHWRLRHTGSYRTSGGAGSYTAVSTYAERPLPTIGARLTLGDHYTGGSQLDSFRLRGISLTTDERMLPESATGYAPVVRGVAETNALVRVKQRGVTLYETTVSPGAFSIDDLHPTGYGGDLDVDIVESDGRVRTFSIPYASTPELLREGQNRFSLTVGQFNEPLTPYQPWLVQGTLARGWRDGMTGYMAGAVAMGYRSTQLGIARNTRIGALSFDATAAQTHMGPLGAHTGYQLQARYSKNFSERGATIALGAFRYSTEGYFGMADAFRAKDVLRRPGGARTYSRLRGRMDASFNKTLGRFGALNLSASSLEYWGAREKNTHMSAGYSARLGHTTVGLNAMRSAVLTLDGAKQENSIHLALSMPLGVAPRSPTVSIGADRRGRGMFGQRVGVNGRIGNDRPISYTASMARGTGRETFTSATVQHSTSIADLQAGISHGNGISNASWGVSGGVVAHRGGITLAPSLGETIALVAAPGASGARIGHGRTRVGRRGYAVVPNLTAYRTNTVSIDPAGSSMDVQISNTSAQVAPTAGAIVHVPFSSKAGYALLVETPMRNGSHLPFGAEVLDADGRRVGIVGQNGRLFVSADKSPGELVVRWGATEDTQCRIMLPATWRDAQANAYSTVHAPCDAAHAPTQAADGELYEPQSVPDTAPFTGRHPPSSRRHAGITPHDRYVGPIRYQAALYAAIKALPR